MASTEQAAQLKEQAELALLNNFKPAYDEVLAWLRQDRPNVSDQASGASALPNGEAYYAQRLQAMTTLPMTAREVHNIGLAEVARIQEEMQGIRQAVGFTGSLQEFFNFLREDDQFYFPNTDQGRADYLALADEILSEMYTRCLLYTSPSPRD